MPRSYIDDMAVFATTCHLRLRQDDVPSEDPVVAVPVRRGRRRAAVQAGDALTSSPSPVPALTCPVLPARNLWNLEHITADRLPAPGAAIAGFNLRTATGSEKHGAGFIAGGALVRACRINAVPRVSCPGVLPLLPVAGSDTGP